MSKKDFFVLLFTVGHFAAAMAARSAGVPVSQVLAWVIEFNQQHDVSYYS